MDKIKKKLLYIFFFALCFTFGSQYIVGNGCLVADRNKVTGVFVCSIFAPQSLKELRAIILDEKKPISIMGAGYSQGGQTAYSNGTVIDMKHFNKIINLDVFNLEITVQAGALWQDVQKYIDPYNLSVRVMQSYNNFSVGGSLSVNVHGRFVADGPIIETVKSVRVMLANGEIVTASRNENASLFSAVIGGYGACGVIVEATLLLTDNIRIKRETAWMDFNRYLDFFYKNILNDKNAVLHNADLYPNEFNRIHAVTWYKTDEDVTTLDRIQPDSFFVSKQIIGEQFLRSVPFAKKVRSLFEPIKMSKNEVVWRNYEMSYSVKSLEPLTRVFSINILQEYFIPVDKLEKFISQLRTTIEKYNINILNLSLRYVHKNTESLLSYAPKNSFACVLYVNIFNRESSRDYCKLWTNELINHAINCDGTYYLPYQLHATQRQLQTAYPRFDEFLAVKSKYDPASVFSNSFFKKYATIIEFS